MAKTVSFADRVAGAALGQASGDAFGFQVERGGPRLAAAHVDGWLRGGEARDPARDGHPLGQVSDDTQASRVLVRSVLSQGRLDALHHARALAAAADDLVGGGGNTLRMLGALAAAPALAGGDLPAALVQRDALVDSDARGSAHAASNGVVMRAWPHAVLHRHGEALARSVLADAALTHRHPEAGACAVTCALATRLLFEGADPGRLHEALRREMPAGGETGSLDLADALCAAGPDAPDLAWREAGRPRVWRHVFPGARVTVAWALLALRLGHPEGGARVLALAVEPGGDVDTTAGLALGWMGAAQGTDAVPGWLADRVTDRGRWGRREIEADARAFAALGAEPA